MRSVNIVTKGKINREACENCLVFYGHSQHSGTPDGKNQIEMMESIEKLYKTIDAKLQLLKLANRLRDREWKLYSNGKAAQHPSKEGGRSP